MSVSRGKSFSFTNVALVFDEHYGLVVFGTGLIGQRFQRGRLPHCALAAVHFLLKDFAFTYHNCRIRRRPQGFCIQRAFAASHLVDMNS